MKVSFGFLNSMALAVLVGGLALLPAGVEGQGQRGGGGGAAPAPPAGPVKRFPNGKPDMTGYWGGGPPQSLGNIQNGITEIGGKPVTDPANRRIPYQPGWEQRAKENNTIKMFDEPELHCFMSGVPSQLWRQFGFQIVHTPDYLLTMNEFMGAIRHIPTDGRPHIPENIKLFNGDSVGRWEGDTLVVETANNNDRTWLDNYGNIHSDALVVVERFTPTDANTIAYEAVLTDPKAYTAPFKVSGAFRRAQLNDPNYEQMEFACIEGNKDVERYTTDVGGKAKPAPSAAPPGSEAPATGGRGQRGPQ